jgi:cysteine desulfurase
MTAAQDDGWADPRRLHSEGRRARALLDDARATFAETLGCRVEEVHLTASHTSSLHRGVLAPAAARRRVGSGVVVSAVERAAVLAAARHVDPDGTPVAVDGAGRVDLDAWAAAVAAPGVAVAALQHANGEVGVLQPLAEAYESARGASVPLLVDAGASLGHVDVPATWDLLAADPADWGGPAGVGVLAVRSRVRTRTVDPEDDDRWAPGGPSVPAAVAAAAALRAVVADQDGAAVARSALRDLVRQAASQVPDTDVAGDLPALPHVLTFSCLYVDGEALVGELDRRGFAVGSGSACTSSTLEPSHVLAAMGLLTHGNVRLALPRGTTREEVDRFCLELPQAVAAVRAVLGVTGL